MVAFVDNRTLPNPLASIRTSDGKSPKEATDHNQRVKKNNSRATAERTDYLYMLQTATVAMFCCRSPVQLPYAAGRARIAKAFAKR